MQRFFQTRRVKAMRLAVKGVLRRRIRKYVCLNLGDFRLDRRFSSRVFEDSGFAGFVEFVSAVPIQMRFVWPQILV